MKKIVLITFLGLLFSCSSETESETTQNSQNTTATNKSSSSEKIEGPASTTTKSYDEPNIVTDFLADITSLEESESKNPIVAFQEIANNTAARKALISKSNIQEMLDEAKNYKHCVITAKNHTIVKIDDINNCKQSGSWGVCMPHARGYIKKGNLVPKEDYINNIIGLPHGESRTMYLFN